MYWSGKKKPQTTVCVAKRGRERSCRFSVFTAPPPPPPHILFPSTQSWHLVSDVKLQFWWFGAEIISSLVFWIEFHWRDGFSRSSWQLWFPYLISREEERALNPFLSFISTNSAFSNNLSALFALLLLREREVPSGALSNIQPTFIIICRDGFHGNRRYFCHKVAFWLPPFFGVSRACIPFVSSLELLGIYCPTTLGNNQSQREVKAAAF